jgi:predicted ATP-grasp superfamily ATP-dependent carboligase
MIPVVAVGNELNTLGVVRSLARSGIPVFVASDTRFCAVGLSRFCTLVRVPGLSGRALVDGLKLVAGQVGQKAVLLLSGDQQVKAVTEAREELEPFFFLRLPSTGTVQLLNDKAKFQTYAEQVGFPVPRAAILECGNDGHALASLSMPVVLKPADKTLMFDGSVQRPVRVETLAQATEEAARLHRDVSCVVAQEWIEGEDDDIYFTLFVCGSQNGTSAIFSGRKIICDPPKVGITALCIAAVEEHRRLADLTRHFIEQVHYEGIGGLEFKRDRRTGRFVIVEPTVGRTDWQSEIATLCGINIPLIAYWTALGHGGQPQAPSNHLVAWRSSAAYGPRAGTLARGTRVVDGYFRWSDPLPGIYHYAISAFLLRALRYARRVVRLGWAYALR